MISWKPCSHWQLSNRQFERLKKKKTITNRYALRISTKCPLWSLKVHRVFTPWTPTWRGRWDHKKGFQYICVCHLNGTLIPQIFWNFPFISAHLHGEHVVYWSSLWHNYQVNLIWNIVFYVLLFRNVLHSVNFEIKDDMGELMRSIPKRKITFFEVPKKNSLKTMKMQHLATHSTVWAVLISGYKLNGDRPVRSWNVGVEAHRQHIWLL